MIVSCIGDSLTEGDYGVKGKRGIANVQQKGYPYFLQEILGCVTRNFGKCGYTSSTYLAHYQQGNVDVVGSDVIVVMLGTNGGLLADGECQGNVDYAKLVDLLKKDAPSSKIFLCTPPHVTTNMQMSNYGYAQRVSEAVEFVRRFAKERGLSVIDLAECKEFCDETEELMQPNDGLHFSEIGYITLAEIIAKHITNIA